jgi:hypothetical protein
VRPYMGYVGNKYGCIPIWIHILSPVLMTPTDWANFDADPPWNLPTP